MRTPYIKKIVELHKIHKAIENRKGGGGGSDSGGGGSTADINSELEFLQQITEIIWKDTNGFQFDENHVVPIDDEFDISSIQGYEIIGNIDTADYGLYISYYNSEEDYGSYFIFVTEEEYNYLSTTVDVEKKYFRDWTKNKFAFPITEYILQSYNDFYISEGLYESDDYSVIPGLYLVSSGWMLLGTTRAYWLGTEFLDDNIDEALKVPETKFVFNIPTEGIYSCFVFANYNDFTETIITNLNNLPQRVYKASETDDGEIYLVELSVDSNRFYTIYYKSKTHDWI